VRLYLFRFRSDYGEAAWPFGQKIRRMLQQGYRIHVHCCPLANFTLNRKLFRAFDTRYGVEASEVVIVIFALCHWVV
jgi:hypothetical protein